MRAELVLLLIGLACAAAAIVYPNCEKDEFYNYKTSRCTECSICGDHLYEIEECTPRKNTVCGWCGNPKAEKNLDYIAKCEKYDQNPYKFYGYMKSEFERFGLEGSNELVEDIDDDENDRELPPLPEDADDGEFDDDEDLPELEDEFDNSDDEAEAELRPLLDATETDTDDLILLHPKMLPPLSSDEDDIPEDIRREFFMEEKLRRDKKVLFVRNRDSGYQSAEIDDAINELKQVGGKKLVQEPFIKPEVIDESDIDDDEEDSNDKDDEQKIVKSAEEIEGVGWVVITVKDDEKFNREDPLRSYDEITRELQEEINAAQRYNTFLLLKRVFWWTLWFLIFFLIFVRTIRKCRRASQPRYEDLQHQINNEMIDRCASQMRAKGIDIDVDAPRFVSAPNGVVFVRGYENPLHNPVQDV